MNANHPAPTRRLKPHSPGAWIQLQSEFLALAQALASPGRLVSQVERMRELQLQAQGIESSNPARAATLRRAASRCLQS